MTRSEHVDADVASAVGRATDGRLVATQVVQTLWGGYGQIVRCRIDGGSRPSVIVKHVRWPHERDHPYGWVSDRSHARKVESYRVETAWYDRFAMRCPAACRVPECLGIESRNDGVVLVVEDLDASGFAGRRSRLSDDELDACLSWLANFHATFLGERPDELWPTGTYWHLATRPDELDALEPGPLKSLASDIDRRLAESRFLTLVHGDAKVANFCFDHDGRAVAAVDFQYVGGGCGMKDLAYFVSSCLDEDESEQLEARVLDRYFDLLGAAVAVTAPSIDAEALEADWRPLYAVAWTDFYRFLQGWSPGHWKLHRYSERLAAEVIASFGSP